MADEELIARELPDIGFYTDAAGSNGREERDLSPVVVMAVNRAGKDVACE